MRKVVVYNRITLDGFFAGEGGSIDWFIHDPAVDQAAHELMHPDTLVFGRVTYQQFEAFWPHVAADPDVPAQMRAIGAELDQLQKVVFSRSLTEVTWQNSTLVAGDVAQQVTKLAREDGADIAVFGSGTIVRALARDGLVDEYLLILTPALLGSGQLLFEDIDEADLELLAVRSFDSGNVLLHYQVGKGE